MLPSLVVILCIFVVHIDGHGRLISPPGRSTMWRYGFNTPRNSDDHQLSCGGFGTQFYRNGGRCGICGDPYDGERKNEAGGLYATGTIANTYKQGQTISVQIEVTVNHGGWFEFRLCPNNDPKKTATQQCLDKFLLRQPGGANRYNMPAGLGIMSVPLELPKDLTCTQCVLQWKWNTASNVRCDGSQCCRGCGPQEQFYGCADIAVSASGSSSTHGSEIPPNHSTYIQPNPNIPQSFIPVPSGQDNHNNQNTGNTMPSGIIAIPVDHSDICQATNAFKFVNPLADTWCMINCNSGYCPSEKCTESCSKIVPSGSGKNSDCKATAFWRQIHQGADVWCRQQCNAGLCPKEYCDDSCRKG